MIPDDRKSARKGGKDSRLKEPFAGEAKNPELSELFLGTNKIRTAEQSENAFETNQKIF